MTARGCGLRNRVANLMTAFTAVPKNPNPLDESDGQFVYVVPESGTLFLQLPSGTCRRLQDGSQLRNATLPVRH
jgi:hypothetical protein